MLSSSLCRSAYSSAVAGRELFSMLIIYSTDRRQDAHHHNITEAISIPLAARESGKVAKHYQQATLPISILVASGAMFRLVMLHPTAYH